MALLEGSAPRSAEQRREQTAADKRAAIVGAIGFALTFVALIGLPGPDGIFMGAAPVIAIVCAFPALMSMWMERTGAALRACSS